MTSEDLFDSLPAEDVQTSAPAEETQPKKKVVVKRKRPVKVVKKENVSAQAEETQLPLDIAEEPEESLKTAEPEVAPEAAAAEEIRQEAPAEEIKPESAPEEAKQAETAEAEETPAQEEAAPAKEGEPKENGKGNNNSHGSRKNNKNNQKNQKNKQREETIPEVNLDENPDAPMLFISDLTVLTLDRLREMGAEKGMTEETILDCRKQDLIREILKLHAMQGGALMVRGTIEILSDGYGFIRYAKNSYLAGTEDVYVHQSIIKGCGLRTGDVIYGQLKNPREQERFLSILKVITVNDVTPHQAKLRVPFDSLTPLFPDEKLNLEYADNPASPARMDLATRVVNLFAPIGKGQRALIVAPPRTGKTVLLQKIANAITTNHPEVTLIVLLVDERPEEVTDMRRNVKAEVIASTFDEQATRHVQVAEMVIEKAKRLVELHKDVVILLDSITRLARAYNQTVPASGKILSGGVDSNALHKPKRFLGAARNIEEGGSLTIISTALIETGSRMDEVIFEEFKGTGNNEVVLDRKMADSRKYPAINLKKSGTRREDLLLTPVEQTRLWALRNSCSNMDDYDMSVQLIDTMRKTDNNKEFLDKIAESSVEAMAYRR